MNRLFQWGGLCVFLLLWSMAAPAAAAEEGTAKAALAKDAVCTKCHNESYINTILAMYQSRHGNKADARTPGCQDCHGLSPAHIETPDLPPDVDYTARSKNLSSPAVRNAACLKCHDTDGVLPRANWEGSAHESRGVACTDCHNNHSPDVMKVLDKTTQADVCFKCHKEQRAQVRRISSHPLAVTGIGSPAKMGCSDCHNPHGSTGPTLLIKNTVNEVCYTCHAEKRGPFLWEHSPVVDSCINCHTPHGSTNAPLLKVRAPFLCQECHSGDHGAAINSGANLANGDATTVTGLQRIAAAAPRAQLAARACLNCHVLVHGSNHPAGSKYQR